MAVSDGRQRHDGQAEYKRRNKNVNARTGLNTFLLLVMSNLAGVGVTALGITALGVTAVGVTAVGLAGVAHAQIADSYPNDVGIESDPDVLYVEKFDDGMTNILGRYSEVQNGIGMSLDSDVPVGSPGPYSLKMTSIAAANNGGHLYKKFSPGWDGTVYVRYYVKYPFISNGYIHHEAVWFGGYNPATNWPDPRAGTCGLGGSRISVSYEPIKEPAMDTYLYWGDMQSWNGGGSCYGNDMVNRSPTARNLDWDNWICVEVMVTLNNPVTAYNGELRIWQDGVEVGHWGPGFPNGHWLVDSWINNPGDPAFPGFRWRTDPALNINYLWIEFYHDDDAAPDSYIKYDHLVMAKKYIGPIHTTTGIVRNETDPSSMLVYPNPTSGKFTVELPDAENGVIELYNILGEKLQQSSIRHAKAEIDISARPRGVYFLRTSHGREVLTSKVVNLGPH